MESGGEKLSLPYADAATRWGIAFERSDELARVVLPSVSRVRNLPKGYFIGSAVLFALLLLNVWMGISRRDPEAIIGVAMYAVPLLIVIASAVRRLNERIFLTITRNDFSLVRGFPRWTGPAVVYPLSRVSVNVNRFNGKLAIHTGLDLIELDTVPDSRVTKEVAQFLQSAILDPPRGVAAPIAPPARKEVGRELLIAFSIFCGVIALFLLLLGLPWAMLAWVPFLVGMFPLGIAYGTQDKEFWI